MRDVPHVDPWADAVSRLAPRASELNLLVDERLARHAHAVSTMPVWANGRRPDFWADLEVRLLLTATHRQMPLMQALGIIEQLLGAGRVPSRSASPRYWPALDRAAAL